MGSLITQVKVVCDKDNSKDQNFVFTVLTDGTKKDLTDTVNAALRQKIEEGELDGQNLRGITIKSDDRRGYFASIVGDLESLLKSL